MKKLLIAVFVLSFVVLPTVSHAGLFDFLRSGQGAQVKTAVTSNTGAYYKKGDRADVILQIQKALNARGLYAGDLSGLIGSKTEASIKAWQKSSGLPVTGLLDVQTINSILGRGSDNGRGGENRDGGFNGNFATPPPSLDYLQSRCNANEPAFVRVISPWEGDQYVYNEDGAELQIFVCDATGTNNTHIIDGLVSQQIDIQNWSAIGPVALVETFDDSNMTPYGANTWLINETLDEDQFVVGHHSLWISDEGGYKINNTPQYGTNVYAGWTRPFEVVNQIGGGNCDSDNVELDILPLTTQMSQIDDLPVLEFRVDNQTNCQVALEDMTFIYMVTDTLPYFEEMSVIDKDTNMVVAEGMIDGSISGESLWVAFNGTNGYMIDAQDEQTFVLYVQSYQQPAQGALGYDDYLNKNLIFGLSETDQVDFKFWENGVEIPQSESWNLGSNRWGSVVRLPASAL